MELQPASGLRKQVKGLVEIYNVKRKKVNKMAILDRIDKNGNLIETRRLK